MTDEMTDEFCRLIELCGKFTYDVVECLFSCLRQQGEGKFTMDELILSLPDKERQLIADVFLGYSDGSPLIGCTKEEAEKLI
jgi:hypothetical protein